MDSRALRSWPVANGIGLLRIEIGFVDAIAVDRATWLALSDPGFRS